GVRAGGSCGTLLSRHLPGMGDVAVGTPTQPGDGELLPASPFITRPGLPAAGAASVAALLVGVVGGGVVLFFDGFEDDGDVVLFVGGFDPGEARVGAAEGRDGFGEGGAAHAMAP